MEIFTVISGICGANCHLICDGKSAIAVDPTDDARYVIERATRLGVKIEHILITHGHYDHCGGLHDFIGSGARIYMPRRDYDELEDLNEMFGVRIKHFDVDLFVSGGDVLDISGHTVEVIATPGHTVGSVCYLMDKKHLFSGDTLFRRSVGRTDFVGGDFSELVDSINKLYDLDGKTVVYPGHGSNTSIQEEKENNPYVAAYRG